jgi:hypothetical protein
MRKAGWDAILMAVLGLVAACGGRAAQAADDRLEFYVLDDESRTDTCRYADSISIAGNGTAEFRDSSGQASDGYWSRDAAKLHASAGKVVLDGALDGNDLHATVVVSSWQGKQTDKCDYQGTHADGAPWYTR